MKILRNILVALATVASALAVPVNVQKTDSISNNLTAPIVAGSGVSISATGTGRVVATDFSPASVSAGQVFAGPATGAPAIGSFRPLVSSDIPDLSALYVTSARTISTGTGLTGGGDLSANRTLSVTGNLVTLFNLANGTGWLHNDGSGVYVYSTPTASDVGAVPTSRTLTASTGLTGGGDLTANRSFAVTGNLSTLFSLANSAGWLHNDGSGVFIYSTPTKSDVGLGNVENTALSTWAGSINLNTLGTVGTGSWNATAIADGKIAAALTGKSYNGVTPTALATGFSLAGGASSKTLTVSNSLTLAAANDTSTLNISTGGTLGSAAFTSSGAYQPLATNLTSLAGLSWVSTSFVKMTAAGTFGLDTGSYQPLATNLTSIGAVANTTGWLKNNGTGTFSYTTPTATDVGLGNVTNNTQTNASIVPNTAPAAGRILVGNAAGTAYAPVAASGDATIASAGAITVAKVNGVAYGTSPATNTVPVVTGTNAITYEQAPNAALANSSITIAGNATALGGAVTQDQITGLSVVGQVGRTGSNTLSALLNPVYVDWYGATGNGSTDDTTAISNAITAAGAGGTVVFTPGKTYKMTSEITIPADGMTLIGYGAAISSDTDAHFQKFLCNGRTGVTFAGIAFDGAYASASKTIGAGTLEFKTSCSDCTVKDCSFSNIAQSGVFASTGTRIRIEGNSFYRNFCAIHTDDDTVTQPTYFVIIRNQIRTGLSATTVNLSGGIKMSGTGTVNSHAGHVIANNVLLDVGQVGIELQTWVNDCSVTGNTVNGAGFGISFSGVARCTAAGNTIKNITPNIGIEDSGCTGDAITGNTIDVRDASGTTSAASCIGLNSTSVGCTITGNKLTGSSGAHLDGQVITDTSIVGNSIALVSGATGAVAINLKDYLRVNVADNLLRAAAGNYFIFLDSTDQSCSDLKIGGNHFTGSVTSVGIEVYCPNANTQSVVSVTENFVDGSSGSSFLTFGDITKTSLFDIRNNYGGGGFTNAINVPIYSVSASDSLDARKNAVSTDATTGVRTITLPSAVGIYGAPYTIIKSDNSTNAVTVATTSAQTINGGTTATLSSQYDFLNVISNGSNWVVTGRGQAVAAVTNQWIDSISTAGLAHLSQPAFSNISGSVATAQLASASLQSLAGLTYASLSFVKMSATGTFSLDTNTYLTSGTGVSSITGTAGQILANGATSAQVGAVTLTLPSALTGINSVTAVASTDLTLNAGSGTQNIVLSPTTPAGGSTVTVNSALKINGDYQLIFAGTAGGSGTDGITYTDSGSTNRPALFFPGSNVVALANRASNGVVQIRANGVTAGSGGEVIAGVFNATSGTGHLLLGGLTTDGTGVLQLPAATTSAGGITFGTDVNLFRSATAVLKLVGALNIAAGSNPDSLQMGGATVLTRDTGTGTWQITSNAGSGILATAGVTALTLDANQRSSFTPGAIASGTTAYFKVQAPADTGLTTATESIGFNVLGATRTWVDGTVATQREILFQAPTYNKTTTSAIFSIAATVAISGAPVAGSGVTLTSTRAFWVQSGLAQFDGTIFDALTTDSSSTGTGSFITLGGVGIAKQLQVGGAFTLTPAARASSVTPYYLITAAADTGITTATEAIGENHATATRTWVDGTVALQRERFFAGVTYAKTTTSATFTDAFNVYITPNVAAAGVTITRNHSLGIVDATAPSSSITGAVVISAAVGTTATSTGIGNGIINTGGAITAGGLITGATITSTGQFTASGASTFTGAMTVNNAATFNGTNATIAWTELQTARSSGILPYWKLTIPADTGQTASTESPGFLTVTGIRTWATSGTVTQQREYLFVAPTYASASASQTFTIAATMAISGAPIQGTNAILTTPLALWIQGGASRFERPGIGVTSTDGLVLYNGTAAAVGAQQWSPRLHFVGQGWKTTATAASETVDYIIEAQPTQASATPNENLNFGMQINGAGYNTMFAIWAEDVGDGSGTTGGTYRFGNLINATDVTQILLANNRNGVIGRLGIGGESRGGTTFGVPNAQNLIFQVNKGLGIGTTSADSLVLGTNGSAALTITSAQVATFASTISTADPLNGVGAWLLGKVRTSTALVPSTTTGMQIKVDGTVYTLAVLSTNP